MEEISSEAAARAASLIGLGARSGAVVVGLSAVRRTRDLALIFVDATLSANTQSELERRRRQGVRLFRLAPLSALTGTMGREDASVLGVRQGSMAEGLLARLAADLR